ncbi:hypothetical protein V8G54_028529, partial [Vigna mungo]
SSSTHTRTPPLNHYIIFPSPLLKNNTTEQAQPQEHTTSTTIITLSSSPSNIITSFWAHQDRQSIFPIFIFHHDPNQQPWKENQTTPQAKHTFITFLPRTDSSTNSIQNQIQISEE